MFGALKLSGFHLTKLRADKIIFSDNCTDYKLNNHHMVFATELSGSNILTYHKTTIQY